MRHALIGRSRRWRCAAAGLAFVVISRWMKHERRARAKKGEGDTAREARNNQVTPTRTTRKTLLSVSERAVSIISCARDSPIFNLYRPRLITVVVFILFS